MKKILMVIGTRPEAIKMAPIYLNLKQNKNFLTKLCVTAQHREMLDDVIDKFEICPDYDLDLMTADQTLSDLTALILMRLRKILDIEAPEMVLVHGDTTTTLAASLAAFYQKIPIAHVEAGLRSGNKMSPWPEEMNRKLVSSMATIHFCPTEMNAGNLRKEYIPKETLHVTGNSVIDALYMAVQRLHLKPEIIYGFLDRYPDLDVKKKYILVTCHRRENIGQGLINICNAISMVAKKYSDLQVIFSVHPNPLVKAQVYKSLAGQHNVFLIEPPNYFEFVYLLQNSMFVLTDSGGIQEEAPALGKPVLVLRSQTERSEAVAAGTVILVGSDPDNIVSSASKLIENKDFYIQMAAKINPYGDGKTSGTISQILENYFET